MTGSEPAVGMLLFVLLGFGSNSRDVVSYLNPDDYFKSRNVETKVERLLELAAKSPADGKDQVMQLLALRKLAMDPTARGNRRVRALLTQIAEGTKGKDRLGFAKDYARQALAKLDGKEPAAPTMPKNSLRSEAFKWFPKDTAIVAGFDLRPVPGVAAVEVSGLQALGQKFIKEANMEKVYEFVEKLGNVRLDRFSVGLAPDPLGGRNARIFVRITGKADHRRVVDFLREVMKAGIVREERGADKEPITFLRAADQPPAVAMIGDSEILLAGYMMRDQGDHMAVLFEMLEVRAGKKVGVTAGPLAARLKKAHAQSFILMAGDITKELGLGPLGAPGVNGQDTMPKALVMEVTRKTAGLDLIVEALMENEADAERLAEAATKGLREGIEQVRREMTRNPDVPKEAVELVTKTMETVKVQAKAANLHISVRISNEVMKAVPDLLGKLGAIPGGPQPQFKQEFKDKGDIKEFKRSPARERRGAPNLPPGASGRQTRMPAPAPLWAAAARACPSRAFSRRTAPVAV